MSFLHTERRLAFRYYIFVCTLLFFSLAVSSGPGARAADDPGNKIIGIDSKKIADGLIVRITTEREATYTSYELPNPNRLVVDIADAVLGKEIPTTLPDNDVTILSASYLSGNEPKLTRFEFTLLGDVDHRVEQKDKTITLTFKAAKSDPAAKSAAGRSGKKGKKGASGKATEITDIRISTTKTETTITLIADGIISDYTYNVLNARAGQPARLYIDLHGIAGETLLREQQVGTSAAVSKIRVAKRGSGLRVVLDAVGREIFPYEIFNKKNRLEIVVREPASSSRKKSTASASSGTQSDPELAMQLPEIQEAETELKDSFTFSGYNKQRITVDFYKIDLHNVFRLFKEISNINIVVDESVSGSLTLALDNVPWDFALDIILNLKDLQKEERHNTIVILPKGKSFSWPEQVQNNLSFEADEEVAAQEAIVIRQKQSLSPERIAAKKLIQQGRELEKREAFEQAIAAYTQALEKWPDNDRLANRIATIYLVHLGHNAKAAHYAKKALEINPKNYSAALNAAIALANMKKDKEAGQYFDQSVSGKNPSPAALKSYAAYCEENKKYDAAIKLLKRHDAVHGETLDSLVSLARVYDKKGDRKKANEIYRSILFSGYRIPPDLKKYIQGRIAMK